MQPVVDNADAKQFELVVEGQTAFAAYYRTQNTIVFTHSEVPTALQGRGVGSALTRGALDIARARGDEVFPMCPFVAGFIRSHPEYLDLVSERNRRRLKLEAPADHA